MTQIIDQLATIELSPEVLQNLDFGSIYQNFNKNYLDLDRLKNFRTDHEKQNAVMRWWNNDKLQDAQLSAVEIQAEFSKTIGQLMMLNIMQSKKLFEQQIQLNEQQGKLKSQAEGIAEHAGELQNQHQVLADQSKKLETLVHEYFELKGLTENGAEDLIRIANEIKATKEEMLSVQISSMAAYDRKQMLDQSTQVLFEKKISTRLNRIDFIVACSSLVMLVMIFYITRLV